MKLFKAFFFISVLILCGACVPSHQILNVKYGESYPAKISQKSVTIVNSRNLVVGAYSKTLDKNFKDSEEFSNFLNGNLKLSLAANNSFEKIDIDNAKSWKHLNSLASKKAYLKIDSLLNTCTSDLLFVVSKFDISQHISQGNSYYDPNAGMYVNSASTEYMFMVLELKLYDVKTRKVVLEYTVKDRSGITLWNYSDSFVKLIRKVTDIAAQYLAQYG